MAADDIQFNTDVLDVKDKQNIDLSQFSKRGYIMPGDYTFTIKVNQNQLEEQPVSVLADENDKSQTRVCFTPDQVKKFGFKEKYFTQLKTWHNGQCVDVTALNGVEATPDLGSGTLTLNVPVLSIVHSLRAVPAAAAPRRGGVVTTSTGACQSVAARPLRRSGAHAYRLQRDRALCESPAHAP
ncbi:FimD/PapC N-terminal domain-containing protein [Cronobacter dublinensis]|uniref:FimD/PapC N-terminal domain-containing protein n=1 Tax=Cronobacter dublinensis TaxID=413497 RepID=UPI00387DBFD8